MHFFDLENRSTSIAVIAVIYTVVVMAICFPVQGATGHPLSNEYFSLIRENEKSGNLDWAKAYAERLLQSRKDLEPRILKTLFRICLKTGDFEKCREIITRLTKKTGRDDIDSLEEMFEAAEAAYERDRILQSEVESQVLMKLRPSPKPESEDTENHENPEPPPRPSYGATIDWLWKLVDEGNFGDAASGWYTEASRNREFIALDDGGLSEILIEHFRTACNAGSVDLYLKGCLEALAGDPDLAVTALRAFLVGAGDADPRISDARGHLSFLASIRTGATASAKKSNTRTKLLEIKKKVDSLEKTVRTPREARKQLDYLKNYQKDLRDEIYFLKMEYNNRAIDKNREIDESLARSLAEAGSAQAPEITSYYERKRKEDIDALLAERNDAISLTQRRIEAVSSETYNYEKLLKKLK